MAAAKAKALPRDAQRTATCALDAARCAAERRRAERERCAALTQAGARPPAAGGAFELKYNEL
jgi:hypothetical protein